MRFEDYAKLDAINWTRLRRLRDGSPYHYRYFEEHDGGDADILRLGRAAHAMLLEPETVEAAFTVFTGKVRNGKVWDAFEAEHADKTILTVSQWEQAVAFAKAIRKHPVAVSYLDGDAEKTLTWTDAATGLPCKCRVDLLSRRFGSVVDIKTMARIEERTVRNAIHRYGLNCQLAHYRNGVIARGHLVDPRCVIIAVEKSPPYDVGVFPLDAESIEKGTDEVAGLLGRVKECIENNAWPGRYPAETTMGLPAWAIDGELTFENEE